MNVRAFDNIFARRTILPIANMITEVINNELFKDSNNKFQFANVVPADNEQIRLDFTSNIITLNEARIKKGEKPIK